MKILVCGLPLRLRAILQGHFSDLEIAVARTSEQALELLEDEDYEALVIDESMVEAPQPFFIALDQAFLGTVIFLARGRHAADEIRDLVERGPHSVILHHPLDPDEVARRLASQLHLQFAPPPKPASSGLDSELLHVWEDHRALVDERLNLLSRLSQKDPSQLSGEALDEAWRAAFQLTGTLGTFGLAEATALAREAHTMIKAAQDDAETLDCDRLIKLVGLISQMVSSHENDVPSSQREGNILLVTDDLDFVRAMEVETLLLNWTVVAASDRSALLKHLADPLVRAVAIDLDSSCAQGEPEVHQDLLHDGIPCLLLSREPYTIPEDASHLSWLAHPVSPYQAFMAVLRSQVAPAPEYPHTVLVVDDDPIVLTVVSTSLARADMHVCCVENPLEFWDVLAREKPHLVILDVDLPPLGGIELCRALRNHPLYAGLPVVFISSYTDPEILTKAFQAGGDDYLYKPVASQELITRVQNRLDRTRQVALNPFPLCWCEDTLARLNATLLEATKARESVALASVSVDGDSLPRLLRLLRRTLRSKDILRRQGEEELLVALPGVGKEAARHRLTSLLEWEGEHAWMGFAEFPADSIDLKTLWERAKRQREQALPDILVSAVID